MQEATQNNHHTHRKHRHRKDDSEKFKDQQLRSIKRKKAFEKYFFLLSCAVAIIIMLAVFWLYTNE